MNALELTTARVNALERANAAAAEDRKGLLAELTTARMEAAEAAALRGTALAEGEAAKAALAMAERVARLRQAQLDAHEAEDQRLRHDTSGTVAALAKAQAALQLVSADKEEAMREAHAARTEAAAARAEADEHRRIAQTADDECASLRSRLEAAAEALQDARAATHAASAHGFSLERELQQAQAKAYEADAAAAAAAAREQVLAERSARHEESAAQARLAAEKAEALLTAALRQHEALERALESHAAEPGEQMQRLQASVGAQQQRATLAERRAAELHSCLVEMASGLKAHRAHVAQLKGLHAEQAQQVLERAERPSAECHLSAI